MAKEQAYTVREEVANSLTHGLGMVLSAAGLAILVIFASWYGTAIHVVSCAIYGATLVFMYTASTLYHTTRSPALKHIWQIIDHVAIFLLIAGTYTPFTLVLLKDGWGWILFGVIWVCALLGIGFKLFSSGRFRRASTLFYLIMGWMVVFFIKPMFAVLDLGGMIWIIAGGLCYTIGVIFYLWERLPYSHAVWHLFVLAGSICHYFAVLFYVIPGLGD